MAPTTIYYCSLSGGLADRGTPSSSWAHACSPIQCSEMVPEVIAPAVGWRACSPCLSGQAGFCTRGSPRFPATQSPRGQPALVRSGPRAAIQEQAEYGAASLLRRSLRTSTTTASTASDGAKKSHGQGRGNRYPSGAVGGGQAPLQRGLGTMMGGLVGAVSANKLPHQFYLLLILKCVLWPRPGDTGWGHSGNACP